VSYGDSISPVYYEREQAAIFKRAWLNIGRVEQLPRVGSYFTKDVRAAHAASAGRQGKPGGHARP